MVIGATVGGLLLFAVGAIIAAAKNSEADESTLTTPSAAVRGGGLFVAMCVVASIAGATANRLKLPSFLGWGLVMGIAFAFLSVGNVLLQLTPDRPFWTALWDGFGRGFVPGLIAGPLITWIQRKQHQTVTATPNNRDRT